MQTLAIDLNFQGHLRVADRDFYFIVQVIHHVLKHHHHPLGDAQARKVLRDIFARLNSA